MPTNPIGRRACESAVIALFLLASCSTSDPEPQAAQRIEDPASFYVETVPTTTPLPPTTLPPTTKPPTTKARAARHRVERIPLATPTSVRVVPAASGCGPGRKSRAQSDACWTPLLARYGWNVSTAQRILYCESKGDQNAVGPPTRYGRAQGLMQILPGGSFDPATNIAQAWQKYQARGWKPWTCR